MSKTKGHKDGLKVRGFFRVQITEEGKGVMGDSGWKENQVTNDGIKEYIVDWLTSGAGKSVGFMALGTGGAPASNATSLAGELTHSTSGRAAVSSSIIASATAQFTGAFASANSFVTATADISNIGLFDISTTGAGTLFAGNTFASSSCAKDSGTCKSNFAKKNFQSRWNPLKNRENTEPSLEIGRRNDWMEISMNSWMKVQSELMGDYENMTEMIMSNYNI